MESRPRLLLADDHELMLDGLRGLLSKDFDLAGFASDGRAAVSAYARLLPDAILLDMMLPLLNGIEVARQIKSQWPQARILFVTMQTDKDFLREAFRAGALGYVLKRSAASELIHAIHSVLQGKYYLTPAIASEAGVGTIDPAKNPADLFGGTLTPRQREVLQLVAEGKTVKEISAILRISVRTVEFHKSGITEELGLHTTAELTRYALEHGLIGQ